MRRRYDDHDHEFLEPSDVEFDEIAAVYRDCDHFVVTDEWVDDARDEVYQDGYGCDATKVEYYKLVEVTIEGALSNPLGQDIDLTIEEEFIPETADEISHFEDILIHMGQLLDEMDPIEADMHLTDGTFAFEHADDERVVTRWEQYDEEVNV